MTGSLEPSEPISTSKDVMETVSSDDDEEDEDEDDDDDGQFFPLLRHGADVALDGLGGALLGDLVTLGLGAAVGDAGLDEDEHDNELEELLSRTQVLLLTVSLAPIL